MIIVPSNVGGLPKVEYDIREGTAAFGMPAHSAGDFLFAVLWDGTYSGVPWLNDSWTSIATWANSHRAAYTIATGSNMPSPMSSPKGSGTMPNGYQTWVMRNAKSISNSGSSPYTLQDSSGKSAVLLATSYGVVGQPQTSPWNRTVDWSQPGFYWLVNTQVSQTPDVPGGVTVGSSSWIFEFKNA